MRKLVLSALLLPLLVAGAAKTNPWRLFGKKLPNDRKTLHALNRLTFGPRAGDVESVRKTGLKKWIDRQLHPERIKENPELLAKLKPLDTLQMSTQEILANYPPPQLLQQLSQGRVAEALLPQDPVVRSRVQRAAEMLKQRREGNTERSKPKSLDQLLDPEQTNILRTGTNEEKIRLLKEMPEENFVAVSGALPPNVRRALFPVSSTGLQRRLFASSTPQQVIVYDLTEAKVLRAVYGAKQLEEVLVDFWYNHFNVFLDKGDDRFMITAYERDAIRPNVLGKFKDLLVATAQDPAMLFYLDNWQSVAPPPLPPPGRKGAPPRVQRGLNENYARELLELHTLGVDGGYTQADIIAVARCFTGWTIREPFRSAVFDYNDRVHDKGEKVVLGVTISAGGGKEDGLKVLDILAHHPSTARFISRKLAQRFVADDPPPALVDRMAKTFRETDGDLRAVMKTMLDSKEFWSEGAWRAKMKSPLEMVASAIRATGAEVESAFQVSNQLQQLGQPLYRKMEPTGYSSSNAEWTNSAALLARMNFGLALAQNRAPGLKVDTKRFDKLADPGAIARSVLFTESTAATKAAISQNGKGAQPAKIAGLVLGSPEFQKR